MALVKQDAGAEKLAEAGRNLNDTSSAVRSRACTTVALAGKDGAQYFDTVLNLMLADESLEVKRNAAAAVSLVAAGQEAKATETLAKALSSDDAAMRAIAARGLGSLKATGTVAQLGGMLTDSHMTVRDAALGALAACGGASKSEAKAVAANLGVPMLRQAACLALGKMGAEGAAYAEDMAVYLQDSDSQIRLAIAEAFGDLKDFIPDNVVSKVGALLDHQSDRYRATAAITIGALGSAKGQKYATTIARMLKEVTNTTPAALSPNCAACIALGKMGVKGDEVAAYLSATKAVMRAAACQGLAELGKDDASKYVPKIEECLKDENSGVRDAATRALAKISAK